MSAKLALAQLESLGNGASGRSPAQRQQQGKAAGRGKGKKTVAPIVERKSLVESLKPKPDASKRVIEALLATGTESERARRLLAKMSQKKR